MNYRSQIIVFAACVWFSAQSAEAHEFWLEREAPSLAEPFIVNGYQGEGLAGRRFPMSPHADASWWADPSGTIPNELIRYQPDGSVELELDDLSDKTQIGYRSGPALQRHDDFESFKDFVTDEGLPALADEHLARGLPEQNFFEVFYRHTQLQLCLENEAPVDSLPMPLLYQWQAARMKNQNQSEPDNRWEFKLLVGGIPQAEQPVHVFSAADSKSPVLVREHTNGNGVLNLSVEPGSHYLISTTILKTPERKVMLETAAIWESHWVSLRFDASRLCAS